MAEKNNLFQWPRFLSTAGQPERMAKKQFISMAPARGPAGWPQKIACGYFYGVSLEALYGLKQPPLLVSQDSIGFGATVLTLRIFQKGRQSL